MVAARPSSNREIIIDKLLDAIIELPTDNLESMLKNAEGDLRLIERWKKSIYEHTTVTDVDGMLRRVKDRMKAKGRI